MKKFKKAMALSLALAMGLSLCACGDDKDKDETTTEATTAATTEATGDDATGDDATGDDASTPAVAMPAADGETIYVYSWNEEIGSRLQYFRDKYPEYSDMVEYVSLGLGGTSTDYITAIENAVNNGGDKVPSIIGFDNDVALYFISQDSFVSMEDIGITNDMYSNAYQYTVDYATVDGSLKALTWQAAVGGFTYRTDIAEEVLETSDPAEVQEYVKDWDTFYETAGTMKDAGYYMISGADDLKYAMIDQKTSPWVSDDTLNFDAVVTEYLEYAKKMYDAGYTNKTSMWSPEWTANFDGDVFGYFGCTWFVYWTIGADETDADGNATGNHAHSTYGSWAMCQGPVDYHWGGTYLGVTDACPNKELAALVLYTLCCDTDVMYQLSEETLDFVNNKAAVEQLISDGKGDSDVLGGQNPLETWAEAAQGISLENATEYDATFNGFLDEASAGYNTGTYATVDDAIQSVKDQVSSGYSFLTVE